MDSQLDTLINNQSITPLFQPIVDLDSSAVVAFEALARGTGDLTSPAALFGAARDQGRLAEVDHLARARAYADFMAAGLPPEVSLFVNVEPEALGVPVPDHLLEMVAAARQCRVVVELTERSLADDPAQVLAAVATARRQGWGVALDDVGAEAASLALLPFVEPEVIKLDLRLVQATDQDTARITSAVRAEAERTGARVLAEGIETERHLQVALAAGATLGQGWMLGRPAALPSQVPVPASLLAPRSSSPVESQTPFEIISSLRPTRRLPKSLMLGTSHQIEDLVHSAGLGAVVLGCFQEARHFTPRTRKRYERISNTAVLTAALGVGLGSHPLPGVRGTDLEPTDPLADEWTVVVVGPYVSAALVGRDVGDTGPDPERRFDCAVTHDRALVLRLARSLLGRLTA